LVEMLLSIAYSPVGRKPTRYSRHLSLGKLCILECMFYINVKLFPIKKSNE
jgi:hypothetical protein